METGEPFRYTRSWFLEIVENETEWERSLKGVPEFDVGKLKSYLTESRNKTFDKEGMRAYKSLKAYKYFEEGYVQKIASVKKGDEFFIRAEVMASMAKKVYKPYVGLSMRGDVRGGSCDCVAGKGEACSHIAALLFAVDDFVSKGFQDLPGDKTVTDRLCEWNKPARRTVEPKTIHNIRIVKQEHGKVLQERQTLAASAFDPRQPADRTRDDGHFNLLVETLRAANPTCGFMKYNSEVRTDKVHAQEKTPVQKLTLPPSLADLRTACNSFKESMEISEEGIQKLEQETVDQSNSELWHSSRKYRLTASAFHSIIFRRETTDPKNLIKNLLYKKRKPTAAMLFGLEQEQATTERFEQEMKKRGSALHLSKRGFIIDSKRTYIGASVDRVATCTMSGDNFIVELKNPHSTWELDIKSAARKLPCLKIDENNKVTLNRKNSYYTQIQGQMAVLNINKCFFTLCTQNDIFIELVNFDSCFWENAIEKLDEFYHNIFLPELVYPSVMYGHAALDLGKFEFL